MGEWLERHLGNVLIVVAVSVLVVVIGIQSAMLHAQGWRVELGSLADWVQAAGTVAAFGALLFAAREWRASQAERRDTEADQARLMVMGPAEESELEPWNLPTDSPHVVVRNHSDSPVFELVVKRVSVPSVATVTHHVVRPEGYTSPVSVQAWTDMNGLTFTFTDARGRRWRRTGSGQPLREIDPDV
ncbi:hypothetical protein [Mycolicibacterium lutetiense]